MLVVGGGGPEVDKLIDLQSIEVDPPRWLFGLVRWLPGLKQGD